MFQNSSWFYRTRAVSNYRKVLDIWMQWMDGVLSQGQHVEFFNDEFRCPVYVKDMVDVILSLTKTWLSGMSLTYIISWNSISSNALSCVHSINIFNMFQFISILVFFLLANAFHCTICQYHGDWLQVHAADGKIVQVLLNVGGPDRVSRLQMAESVAVVRGYNPSIIKSVSASSVLILPLECSIASISAC